MAEMGLNNVNFAAIGTLFENGARIILGSHPALITGIIRASTLIIDRNMVGAGFSHLSRKLKNFQAHQNVARCRGALAPSH